MKNRFILCLSFLCMAAAAQVAAHSGDFMKQVHHDMLMMDRNMMAACMTGDVDHDFASMMQPHHHGAIDMAKEELKYGQDPVMRRLAQEILVDQQSEIDAMQLWLDKHRTTKERATCDSQRLRPFWAFQ